MSIATTTAVQAVGTTGMMVQTYAAKSGDGAISNIFSTLQGSVLTPILQGMLAIIATIAVIVLVKDVIAAATSEQGMEQKNHIKQAVIVLIACLLLGFAPALINLFIGFGGSGGITEASFTSK